MKDRKMKQVVVHYRPKDLRGVGYDRLFVPIERFTVVSQVALMPEKTALLVVIRWKAGPDLSWMDQSPLIDHVVDLGPVKDGNMYLLLGKEEPWYFEMLRKVMEELRVFFDLPVILEPDLMIIRYIGFMENISKIIDLSKEFNPDLEIVSLRDYDPSQRGLAEVLTPMQFDLVEESYRRGFFDDRRGVTINQLATERGISASSYMKTLRRAQRKLIGELIDHG
jgi:hypothetical protein